MFGDPTRLKILFILFEREVCVCDIANIIGKTDCSLAIDFRTVTSPIENVVICGEVIDKILQIQHAKRHVSLA